MRAPLPIRPTARALTRACLGLALGLGAWGCKNDAPAPSLSHVEELVKSAAVPPENAPPLGIIAQSAEVREYTDARAPSLGTLRAGARVPRSLEPVSRSGCAGGWYAIRPRGFVCVGAEATLDLNHPTLVAMALAPTVDAELPYTYARTRVETPLFERSPVTDGAVRSADSVREIGKLRRRAGMAVVGSWKAKEPSGTEARLALLSDGHFVRAADLEAARPSDFKGIELGKGADLPLAFVVKRGVRSFRIEGTDAEKGDLIEYHSELPLAGRFRSLGNMKYWALEASAVQASQGGQELWVRHQDVTVVQKRSQFPDFVRDDLRWLDVSVSMDTLVAYVGKRPVFVTLLSVARELPEAAGDTEPASTGARPIPLGTFTLVRKSLSVTLPGRGASLGEPFEVSDTPWAMELSSGQLLHGAYWHDRFGIEHGAGSFSLSPADAARLFRFAGPELPSGWQAVTVPANQGMPVVIRK
jgi:hypothetical protein